MSKINLHSTVQNLIFSLIKNEQKHLRVLSNTSTLNLLLCDLVKMGLDIYDLLRVLGENNSLQLLQPPEIISLLPHPKSSYNISVRNLSRIIPRWISSKYQIKSLDQVIENIRHSVATGHLGMHVYHSNPNTAKIRAADDIYILIIHTDKAIFIDLNRRRTYELHSGGAYA